MRGTRREFLAAGLGWLLPWNWFKHEVSMAGIRFHYVKHGSSPRRRYIWIHGNEPTAREVLMARLKDAEGALAFFVESKERNVHIDGGQLDPNRMFSRVGAEKNLRSLNPKWTDAQVRHALDRLDGARASFLDRVLPPKGEVLVAVHNNGPGYSMQDEIPISDAVALNAKDHPDEFMLCTIRADFEMLAGGPHNVLLQNRAPKEDDGSLSRLCAARGIRYVNIEAAHGNAAGQRRMLDWVEAVLV